MPLILQKPSVKLTLITLSLCLITSCLISQKQQLRNLQPSTPDSPIVKNAQPSQTPPPDPIKVNTKKGDFIVVANQESESLDLWYRHFDSAQLVLIQRREQSGKVGPMVYNPEKNLLYVGRIDHHIDCYYLDKKNKELILQKSTFINHEPTYIELDSNRNNLFIVTYFDNVLINYALGSSGELNVQMQKISTKDKPHSILFQSNTNTIYVANTGSDRIQAFKWNPSERLIVEPALDNATDTNSGPRHLVKNPNHPLIYASNEYSNSVSTYKINTQNTTLERLATNSTLPPDFFSINTVSDIHITSDGHLLFVGNRGHQSIAVFKINPFGIPEILDHIPTEAKPRDFHLDNNNEYIYVAGQDSGFLSQYNIHRNGLELIMRYEVGKQPTWVEVVADP